MSQALRDTDAYILSQFHDKLKHLKGVQPTKEVQAEAARLGKPFLDALRRNGHSLQDCADMMRATMGLPQRKV
jgi:hypothetical protein